MVIVTMVLVSASLVSLVCFVPFPPAPLRARAMVSVSLLVQTSSVFVMKVTKVMIVLRSLALMIVLTMVTVLMVPVFVRMVGEVMIVLVGALVMVRGAVVMVSVLRESAIATLDGLVMLVTFALACTIALNTVIAQMVLAFAKRVTEVVIALSQLNLNLVNVPSTVCVGVCNNVLRCMRPKELVLLIDRKSVV